MVAKRRSKQPPNGKSTQKSASRKESTVVHDNDDDDENKEEMVDYAATADDFFANLNDDEENEEEDGIGNEDDEDDDDSKDIKDDVNDENEDINNTTDKRLEADDDDNDSIDEEEEEGDDEEDDNDEDEENEDEHDDNDNEEEEEEEEEEDEEEEEEDEDEDDDAQEKMRQQQKIANAGNKIVVPGTEEPCTFDLRNLLAMSSYPIDSNRLYQTSTKLLNDDAIPKNVIISQSNTTVNEEYLVQKSAECCNQLITALWQLPVERSDAGPMALLPSYDESKIPRKLPPPTQRAETKWEKFAKAKGIGQNKDKRSAKVWDDTIGDWQYRHGYKKAGNDAKEWPIMEVKAGDDPMTDPWEKQRDAKRKRVDKNVEQHMRNEERAGKLSKGTSTQVLKSITAGRKAGREGGKLDLPVGLPVDLKSSGKKGNSDVAVTNTTVQRLQRGKTSTAAALLATQVSTASLGKFDKMREGEPERNKAMSKSIVKKRKFESTTDKNVIATEAERSIKVLKSLSAGGVAKEKDRKKGKLATGETAYDYDYDDGLGASTFRKKKGRAGAGKMKKMTKKRTK